MSILIKGIEMPKTCYNCPFAMEYYRTLQMAKGGKFRKDYCCIITHKTITHTKRNRACPLVEVTTPHGRLIDADSLIELCGIMAKKCDGIGESIWNQFAVVVGWASTIIEAEGDEE